jgi:hypothetical protein
MVYRLPCPEIREELLEVFNAVRREDDCGHVFEAQHGRDLG